MDNGACSYRRFLDGDDEGFVEIIRIYKDGMILYLCGITGNIYLAEDLTEDTFVKIITKKPKFAGKSTFKTWLYAIARNVALDYLRKNKGVVLVSTEDIHSLAGDMESLERAYIKEEEKIELHRAMDNLIPDYRQVLWLVYFEGFTAKEVADVMHKSLHSVETLLYRAKRSLKAELEKGGFVYEGL
ncbi:MAG: RNA polymerase sigma factor [Ruminococcaceae bacterium]|nr:RNA polymerase sigma factor [Oscillospiraceae bacterium]